MLLPSDRFAPLNCCENQYCPVEQVCEAHFSGAILLNNVGNLLLDGRHCDNYFEMIAYNESLRIFTQCEAIPR